MTDKYQNKYRIASTRLQNCDYGSNAPYFVTICTQHREHYFGEIVKTQCIASPLKMQLSEIGKIVETEWIKTFEMRPDMNLQMGEYVIMPNHFHAIIIIGENKYNTECTAQRRDAMHCVPTTNADVNNKSKNKFGPQSKNLASIIRGFKTGVTNNARQIHADFAWQARFHDHIIRNEKSFQTITNYIKTNPVKWSDDKFYPHTKQCKK